MILTLIWLLQLALVYFLTNAVHELGHYIMAKKYNVRVKEVCLFGKEGKVLLSRTINDCLFTIRTDGHRGARVMLIDEFSEHDDKAVIWLLRMGSLANLIVLAFLFIVFFPYLVSDINLLITEVAKYGNILNFIARIPNNPLTFLHYVNKYMFLGLYLLISLLHLINLIPIKIKNMKFDGYHIKQIKKKNKKK